MPFGEVVAMGRSMSGSRPKASRDRSKSPHLVQMKEGRCKNKQTENTLMHATKYARKIRKPASAECKNERKRRGCRNETTKGKGACQVYSNGCGFLRVQRAPLVGKFIRVGWSVA